MNSKKSSRLRRARRSRMKMRELGAVRLSVNRTPRHIYAQVISADGGTILAQASTLEEALRGPSTGNVETASKVGALVAERAKEQSRLLILRVVLLTHGLILSTVLT
jgi:large subunit ribosomal protein L18